MQTLRRRGEVDRHQFSGIDPLPELVDALQRASASQYRFSVPRDRTGYQEPHYRSGPARGLFHRMRLS